MTAKKTVAKKRAVAKKKAAAAKKAPAPKKLAAPAKKAPANKAASPKKVAAPKKATVAKKKAPAKKAPAAKKKAPAKRTTVAKKKAPATVAARYPFVAVDVREPYSGEIAALLFEHGATGVEERDDHTLRRGPGNGSVTVVGAFDTHAAARAAIKAVRKSRPILRPRLEEVVGDAWLDAWKEHFAPFALTPRVTIAPPWSVPAPRPGVRVLVLEPGRAFGTGLHASTSLVASLLEEFAPTFAGRTVLDIGTGSGILALVAVVLGAGLAIGFDVDEDAVAIARENVERNALSDRIEMRVGSAADATGRFDLVLANIEARILLPMAEDLADRVSPGGALILSGILAGERAAIVERYESLGLKHARTVSRGEAAGEAWVAIAFTRPAR